MDCGRSEGVGDGGSFTPDCGQGLGRETALEAGRVRCAGANLSGQNYRALDSRRILLM